MTSPPVSRPCRSHAPRADPAAPPAEQAPTSPPAEEPAGDYYAPRPTAQMTRWTKRYGGKLFLADLLSAGAITTGILYAFGCCLEYGDPPLWVGGLVYGGTLSLLFTPALIHYLEGNSSGVWKSLGVRIGLPVLGGLIAAGLTGDCDSPQERCTGAFVGVAMLVFLGGMGVDWLVFAHVDVQQPVVMPYVAPAPHGGAALGLRMSF